MTTRGLRIPATTTRGSTTDRSGIDDSGIDDSGIDDSGSEDSGSDDSGVSSGSVHSGTSGHSGHSGSSRASGHSGHSGSSLSNSVVSTTSVVSTSSVDAGALVAGSEVGRVSGVVSTTVVVDDAAAASNTSISPGIAAKVVGAVAIVSCGSVPVGRAGSVVVVVETAFGGSTVLSVPCVSPPVVSNMATMARTMIVAAPATQMIERDSFHHEPVGSS